MFIFLLHLNRSFFASSSYLLQCNLYINCLHSGYEEIRDRKLLEILKKDRKWLKYELHCNVKTSAPLFFQNNLTFVIEMLINVFPRIVFVRTFFLHISRESNNITAGNRHKQNSRFCKEIREDNFRFWWRRVHEDASQGIYMSKIEICFFTARILQNQRMLCCGECFHD